MNMANLSIQFNINIKYSIFQTLETARKIVN
jgi:hypothetical protein